MDWKHVQDLNGITHHGWRNPAFHQIVQCILAYFFREPDRMSSVFSDAENSWKNPQEICLKFQKGNGIDGFSIPQYLMNTLYVNST